MMRALETSCAKTTMLKLAPKRQVAHLVARMASLQRPQACRSATKVLSHSTAVIPSLPSLRHPLVRTGLSCSCSTTREKAEDLLAPVRLCQPGLAGHAPGGRLCGSCRVRQHGVRRLLRDLREHRGRPRAVQRCTPAASEACLTRLRGLLRRRTAVLWRRACPMRVAAQAGRIGLPGTGLNALRCLGAMRQAAGVNLRGSTIRCAALLLQAEVRELHACSEGFRALGRVPPRDWYALPSYPEGAQLLRILLLLLLCGAGHPVLCRSARYPSDNSICLLAASDADLDTRGSPPSCARLQKAQRCCVSLQLK